MISLSVYIIAAIHCILLFIFTANLFYLRRRKKQTSLKNAPSVSVSILIPVRNEENNLQRLLPSLLTQRYPNFEIIVYDDDSDDLTWNVITSYKDARLKCVQGEGPPPGWVGKVHALYQASRHASGEYYLFLDADTKLEDEHALERIVHTFTTLPPQRVMTALPRYRGAGLLLVSLVPNALLTYIPWPLVSLTPQESLSALNGQCWMIDASTYHMHEPHREVANEILEDVMIGRFLKTKGIIPVLTNLQKEVAVYMYSGFSDAWQGFRKNAYLLLGNSKLSFGLYIIFMMVVFLMSPSFAPWILGLVYLNKLATDRACKFPLWLTLLAPLSFVLGVTLHIDSAWHHLSGNVSWKGRTVHLENTAIQHPEKIG